MARIFLQMGLMALLFAACETTTSSEDLFPDTALTTAKTDDGLYSVEVRTSPTQPPPRAGAKLDLHVLDDQGKDVDGLTATVIPWMPAMNHGSMAQPTLAARPAGHYTGAPLELFMAGTWQLRITLQKGTQESHVVPSLDVP